MPLERSPAGAMARGGASPPRAVRELLTVHALAVATPLASGAGHSGKHPLFWPHILERRTELLNPPPAPDPVDLLSRFRASYRNYHTLVATSDEPPKDVVVETPAAHPLSEEELPESLRALLQAYREEHPQEKGELLKYMRLVNGAPQHVIEDDRDLPPLEELMTLSQTVTLNTSERVHVITDLFVARRVQ
jgi:hypothetical protein